MKFLFTEAPFFVPGMKMRDFETHDLEHRVHEVEAKQGSISHVNDVETGRPYYPAAG